MFCHYDDGKGSTPQTWFNDAEVSVAEADACVGGTTHVLSDTDQSRRRPLSATR